jgi:hypothetical protein
MSTEDAHERLSALALRAQEGAARFAAQRASHRGPPAPGDLFVLPATAELPVEWAILDRRSAGTAELLAVPADAHPAAGSADVEVPAGSPGGPLSLRCRFSAWLDAGLFATAKRSGSLAAETVAEALLRLRRLDSRTLKPSPLAEEVDADPEYVDWIRDVPERARALALAASQVRSRPPRPRPWEGYRLAAMFALVAIGLSIWVIQLRREVVQLSGPIFDVPSQELVLGEQVRGSRTTLEVPAEASRVVLVLVLDSAIPEQEGHFEIADATGRVLAKSSNRLLTPTKEIRLIVPHALLPDGEYKVRIVSKAGGPPLAENTLEIALPR